MDSLCNQDNIINNQFKEFSTEKEITHRPLPMNKVFNQKKRFLAFSRRNSICSNTSSVRSGINGNKKKDISQNIQNNIDSNLNFNKKDKINFEEKEEEILAKK